MVREIQQDNLIAYIALDRQYLITILSKLISTVEFNIVNLAQI